MWAAPAFLLALTTGLYWQLTLSRQYTWLENPDQAFQIRPWLDFAARELHAGRLPLWDPYLWGGQSLIGQVVPGAINPLNWILFAMPLRDGHIPTTTLHWYWVLIHWLAAMFAFLLCRDLGCGRIAALVGATVFAFLGFMGHAITPQYLMSALWLPLVLLFLARVFRGYRPWSSAALCGAAMGMAFLSGHHNIPIYMTVLMGPLWLWYILDGRGLDGPGLGGRELGGPGLGGRELGGRGRWRARLGQAAVYGAVWLLVSAIQSLPAIEYGRQAVRWSGWPEPQHWNEKVPYSVHAEFSLYWRSIPGMVIPGRGVLHAEPFVGAVALILALAAVLKKPRSVEVRLLAAVALGGLVLALGKDTPIHRWAYDFIPLVDKARYPAMAIAIFQVAIAGLAALGLDAWQWKSGARVRRIAVLALVVVEAASFRVAFNLVDRPNSYASTIAAQSDIAAFLKQQPGWFRVDADEEVVAYNFGDWYGIEQFGGYTASMPVRVYRVNGRRETTDQLGIRYRIARTSLNPSEVAVFHSRSGLTVFERPGVPEPLSLSHVNPCAGGDHARVVSRLPNLFVVDADLACDGYVNTGDIWAPGWRAWVDGKRTAIEERQTPARAVFVPVGHRRIVYRYRPDSFYRGAALTGLGLALTALLWARERKARS